MGAYRISTRPWRAAKTRACSLECTSSLPSMLTMWVRSVSTVMCSFSAISLLSRPSPRACSTCFSRGVSFSMALVLFLALAADHAQHLYDLSRREQSLPRLEAPDGLDDLTYSGGLVQHARGAGLDGPGEAGRLQAGAEDQRHHAGTGSQLFDQPEPIPVG